MAASYLLLIKWAQPLPVQQHSDLLDSCDARAHEEMFLHVTKLRDVY